MKLTKYEHACFAVEKDGKMLIVDPGSFTQSLGTPENVVAVIVTHDHADHLDTAALDAIIAHNPDAVILAPQAVLDHLVDALPQKAVNAGDTISVGPFELEFFGGKHAQIHGRIAIIDNVGVLINGSVYYPGDSFVAPKKPVELLALPVSGPWLKVGEAIDFVLSVKPKKVFPTHNGINSDAGNGMVDTIAGGIAKSEGIHWLPLSVGDALEI